MDARSVGSRGSLYLNLKGNAEALKDAPEAVEVFSKGKGGGRDRQRKREPRAPIIGLHIDASQFETFGNGSNRADNLNKDGEAGRSDDDVSLDNTADWDEPLFDDDDDDDDDDDEEEGGGSMYGEFKLKDEDEDGEMNLKPAAKKEPRSGAAARLAQYEEDVRSVGSRSVKSSKSVHTNPGVLRNDRAPRAKKAAPQQKSAAERLSQFNTMTTRRSFGSVHSAGAAPARTTHAERRNSRDEDIFAGEDAPASTGNATWGAAKDKNPDTSQLASQYKKMLLTQNPVPTSLVGARSGTPLEVDYKNALSQSPTPQSKYAAPSQVGAHRDTRNPLAVDYKNAFSSGTASKPTQPQVGALHDNRNPLEVQYKNEFSATRTAERPAQPQVGAHHDTRNPLAVDYKNEFSTTRTAERPAQPQVGAHHDTRNPLEVQYKNEFSTTRTTERSAQPPVGAHHDARNPLAVDYKNAFSSGRATIPVQSQNSNGSHISSTKHRAPTVFVPPSALQVPHSSTPVVPAPSPAPAIPPPDIVERRKFENARKNLQSSTTKRSTTPAATASPPPQPGVRASLPVQGQPRNPHLMEPRLPLGNNPMDMPGMEIPGDFRSITSSAPGRNSALQEQSTMPPPPTKPKASGSWGSPLVASSSSGWGRSPLAEGSGSTSTTKKKSKSKNQSVPTMQPIEVPTPSTIPVKNSKNKPKESKSKDDSMEEDPPFSKPTRSSSSGSLGALFGGLRRGKNKEKR